MPHTDTRLIATVRRQGIPVIPGAATPTEIVTAWQAGATSVKVFPVTALGGAAYIRQLQGPLGHIPLIPTGGVTLENGPGLLAAGARAIAIASSLFPPDLIAAQAWSEITQRTAQLLAALPKTDPQDWLTDQTLQTLLLP
jgi:2-dehydro-3-deoxyphosphogluconate aldolase/(4S)-4-hydroxy-2-oxoglutarate aldolase